MLYMALHLRGLIVHVLTILCPPLQTEISQAYHQLSLPLDCVHVVDTLDKYNDCLPLITRPGTVVGVDSEWKPAFLGQVQK